MSMVTIIKWSVTPTVTRIVSFVKAKQVLVEGVMTREKLGDKSHVFPSQIFVQAMDKEKTNRERSGVLLKVVFLWNTQHIGLQIFVYNGAGWQI